jgi:hypothetical protein
MKLKWYYFGFFLLCFGVLALANFAKAADYALPDPKLTPGVIDPSCDLHMLQTTTTTGRRHTTEATKNAVYAEYGIQKATRPDCSGPGGSCYEIDHRLPLEICGLDDIKDLWPQKYDGPCNAHMKDALENVTAAQVKSGAIPLAEGQRRLLAPDWTVEYQKVFGKSCDAP